MSLTLNAISYQTATGLMDGNIPFSDDAFYIARKLYLGQVYSLAWSSISPSMEWVTNNRTFFIPGGNFTYTIGNKNFPLVSGTIYCCANSEYQRILDAATAALVSLTASNFAAWAGVGSLETFYW